MNSKIFWVAVFTSLVSSSYAFNIDSSVVIAFGLGHSSVQQPSRSDLGDDYSLGYGAVNLSSSVSWNTSQPFNYVGAAFAGEVQFDLNEGAGTEHPIDYKYSAYLGHQFRFRSITGYSTSYSFPLTIGASGSTGVYRGHYIGTNPTPPGYEPLDYYYDEKRFYAAGGFAEFDPALLTEGGSTFGLPSYLTSTPMPSIFHGVSRHRC